MKRTDITELFPEATKEQIDKLMAINGQDINAMKNDIEALQHQIAGFKEKPNADELTKAQSQIEQLDRNPLQPDARPLDGPVGSRLDEGPGRIRETDIVVAEHHAVNFEEHNPLLAVVAGLHSVDGFYNPLFEQVGRPSFDETVGELALQPLIFDGGVQKVKGTEGAEVVLLGFAFLGCHAQRFCDDHLVDALICFVPVLAVDLLHHLLFQFVFHCSFVLCFYIL